MQDILKRSSYYRRIYAIGARGHHLAAAQKSRLNHFFGVPAAVISAIVGTTLFATLEQNPDTTWRIIVGLVLILSAVLSTLQTRFNYADAAGKHKTLGPDIVLFVVVWKSLNSGALILAWTDSRPYPA